MHILILLFISVYGSPPSAPSYFACRICAKGQNNSSKWINDSGFLPVKFNWQEGGGSFSVSETHIPALRRYIINQKEHHKDLAFKYEYLGLLEKNGIEPDHEYLPDFFEDLY